MTSVFRDNAQRYWGRGLSAVPVKPGTKQPSIDHWSSYQSNLPKEDRRNEWLTNFADHGIGVLLGTEVLPGRVLVALDVDDDRLVRMVEGMLGKAPSGKRGKKGATFFALASKDEKLKATVLKGGEGIGNIDFLASGRFTVLPPTIHPDTKKPYEWTGKDIAKCDFETLPAIDKRKLQILKKVIGSEHAPAILSGTATHAPGVALTAQLVAAGATDEEIEALFKGMLPLNYAGNSLEELPGWIDSAREKGFDRGVQQRLPIDEAVARAIEDELDPLAYVEGDGFLHYKDGYWSAETDSGIGRRAKSHLLELEVEGLVNPYIRHVKSVLSLNVERDGFGDYSGRICLNNGTLNVATGQLEDHAPEHELRFHLDMDWDPKATCPAYEEQVAQTFMNDAQSIALYDEFAALTLIPDMRFQKALYLIGEGGSGKSTMLKIVEMMHDPNAISVTPLDQIDNERHRTNFARKLVVISFDIQTDRKVFGETFVRITGGDPITTRRLYREVEGHVMPTVRFMGSMNPDMPEFIANPDALKRRLILLPCGKKIEKPDPDRFEKLKAERAGILVRWVKALQRLYKRGRFDIPPSAMLEVEDYVHNQDAFDQFAELNLVKDPEAETAVSRIAEAFDVWARSTGAPSLPVQRVGKKLRRLGFEPVFGRREEGGRVVTTRMVKARLVGGGRIDSREF